MELRNLYDKESVGALATAIHAEHPDFDKSRFAALVFDDEWEDRKLKQRMRHIATVLGTCLTAEYRAALDVLQRAMPALGDHGFVKMVFPDYVKVYGLDDWEASMTALEAFTQEASAEFAIRPFIVRDQERTMAQMLEWAGHKHPEVRRLASEGCRPRLPWGMALAALKADPSPILPILERLKQDESESVRRSVANNLNDISKDNHDVVLEMLSRWQAEEAGDDPDKVRWITSHALRSLLKAGRPEALALLGYASDPAVKVHNVRVEPYRVPMGGKVTLSFDIESAHDQPQKLMIDYAVYSVRANGTLTPKVWKLTRKTLQPGETLQISKAHSFAPVTTRRYYPGEHAIEPQINGKRFGRVRFVLG